MSGRAGIDSLGPLCFGHLMADVCDKCSVREFCWDDNVEVELCSVRNYSCISARCEILVNERFAGILRVFKKSVYLIER